MPGQANHHDAHRNSTSPLARLRGSTVVRCPSCATETFEGSRFCPSCGQPLLPSNPGAPAPMGSSTPPDVRGTGWRSAPDRGSDTVEEFAARPPSGMTSAQSANDYTRLVGIVSHFRETQSSRLSHIGAAQRVQVTTLRFLVERYDSNGNRMMPVPQVEIRGSKITGDLHDGDEVEISQLWKPGEVIQTRRVFNRTTQSEVKAKR